MFTIKYKQENYFYLYSLYHLHFNMIFHNKSFHNQVRFNLINIIIFYT